MNLRIIEDLLAAAHDALDFVENRRDVCAEGPNRACYVYDQLKQALDAANDEFDAAKAQDRLERMIDANEHFCGDR